MDGDLPDTGEEGWAASIIEETVSAEQDKTQLLRIIRGSCV